MNIFGVGLLAFFFALVFIPAMPLYYIWVAMKEHRRKSEQRWTI
jgi:hypothetical protein